MRATFDLTLPLSTVAWSAFNERIEEGSTPNMHIELVHQSAQRDRCRLEVTFNGARAGFLTLETGLVDVFYNVVRRGQSEVAADVLPTESAATQALFILNRALTGVDSGDVVHAAQRAASKIDSLDVELEDARGRVEDLSAKTRIDTWYKTSDALRALVAAVESQGLRTTLLWAMEQAESALRGVDELQ